MNEDVSEYQDTTTKQYNLKKDSIVQSDKGLKETRTFQKGNLS